MKDIIVRKTGLTTAIALETVAEAIRNPGKAIRIEDHFQESDTGDADLYNTILQIIEDQKLKFEVKKSRNRYTIKSVWYGIGVSSSTSSWKILTKKDRNKLGEIDF